MLPLEDRVLLQNALVSLSVEEELIAEIMSMLDTSADDLEATPTAAIDGSWFGGSHTGGHRLAANTHLAQQAVEEEMSKLVAALRGYRENIEIFADDVRDTDETIATSMAGIRRSADSVDDRFGGSGRGDSR